jgi:hypothetical protein
MRPQPPDSPIEASNPEINYGTKKWRPAVSTRPVATLCYEIGCTNYYEF